MQHIKLFEEFQEEEEVFPSKGKAYHVTPDIYINKIKEEGLTPKSESKLSQHPDRIYFYLNPESSFKFLASSLWNASKYKDQVKKYYILEVDLNQLPDHHFYGDTESSLMYVPVYTTQKVPPAAIKVIGTIPVEELPDTSYPKDEPNYIPIPKDDPAKADKWEDLLRRVSELPPDKQMIDI
jgi:hypothetical protein